METRLTGARLARTPAATSPSGPRLRRLPGMPEEAITDADWEVFAHYGRTMLTVQAFEFTLFQIVQLQDEDFPEAGEFSEVWRDHIEPLLGLTAGQLRGRLRDIDSDLLAELRAAVDARNFLAHRFIFNYRLAAATGASDHRDAVASLTELQGRFADVNAKLDAIADELIREKGLDPNDDAISSEALEEFLRPWE